MIFVIIFVWISAKLISNLKCGWQNKNVTIDSENIVEFTYCAVQFLELPLFWI